MIITLCGSTKFKKEFLEMQKIFTLEGHIVLTVGFWPHADGEYVSQEEKRMLDQLHLQKIDMSHRIFVINVRGYIGESTRNEIEYAKKIGKSIDYLE